VPASDLRTILGEDGLAVEHVLYEVGTDYLVRVCHAYGGSVISERSIDSHEVVLLMLMSRQWEFPPSERGTPTDVQDSQYMKLVAGRRDPRSLTKESLEVIVWNQSFKDPWLLAHAQDPSDEHSMRRKLIAYLAASFTVPLEGYPQAADDIVFGDAVRSKPDDARRLVVVPFNYLNNLPFHLLSSVREAIDARRLEEVVIVPSVKLLLKAHKRIPARRDAARVLFVGLDVEGSIDANEEFRAIRETYPDTAKLVGEMATHSRIRKSLNKFDVVHIACHGGFDWERNSPFLQVADGHLYPEDFLIGEYCLRNYITCEDLRDIPLDPEPGK